MGTVLEFSEIYRVRMSTDPSNGELPEEAANACGTGKHHAQVIIFPGVRIERSSEETECQPASWEAARPREG